MAGTGPTTRLKHAPPSNVGVGDLLAGRYQIDAVVGWGGQAVVFAATDIRALGQKSPVAIKVVRRDLAATDLRDAISVLRWEAHLLRRLRHPALPRVYHQQHDKADTWFARDLFIGEPLSTRARLPCDPNLVRGWLAQLCDLLTYLHTQSPPVVCGDIKPANVILRPDGTLALIDLGAALTLTRRPPRTPRPRHGTPGYAPPEQLGNWGHDERSDIFSLAVTCYELLTGSDPTAAPLQFDTARLDASGVRLAQALRAALLLEQTERTPTAAALQAAVGSPRSAPALRLEFGVSVVSKRDLLNVATRHPQLLNDAIKQGAVNRWLAQQPDQELGRLLYDLRQAQRTAPRGQPPHTTLLQALAPAAGSRLLDVSPEHIAFGAVPLHSWRIWSQPRTLVLHNGAEQPQQWALEFPPHAAVDVRVWANGRAVRSNSGVLAPGARTTIELVAAGKKGSHSGQVLLHCGNHTSPVDWVAQPQPGVPLGSQFVGTIEEIDLTRQQAIPALEQLLQQGGLVRWLRAQGRRKLAADIAVAMHHKPDEAARLLLVSRVLHELQPNRFPLLNIHGIATNTPLAAGDVAPHTLEFENWGDHSCVVQWRSRTAWALAASGTVVIEPHACQQVRLRFAPPHTLAAGTHAVVLELRAGDLALTLSIPVQITMGHWWQRLRRWVVGE